MGGMATKELTAAWLNNDLRHVSLVLKDFFTRVDVPLDGKTHVQGPPDKTLYARARELGLYGMSIPEEYGGGGGSFANLALLLQEQMALGAGSLGMAVSEGVVAHYLLAYATEEQKHGWLPGLCSGEYVGAIAMMESDTGSDLDGIGTRAVREGDDYLVTGSKSVVTNGQFCDLVIIAVKTDTSHGTSLLVADVGPDTPGFTRDVNLGKLGHPGQEGSELSFTNMRVPAVNLLGGVEGQGDKQFMAQLPQERLITAILAQTMGEASIAAALDYTKTREAYGRPLVDLQTIRFELAEFATITRVNRVFLNECILRHVDGGLDAAKAATAKYWITDRMAEVVGRCHQLFDGYGSCVEYRSSSLVVDNQVLRVLTRTNDVMKELIARSP